VPTSLTPRFCSLLNKRGLSVLKGGNSPYSENGNKWQLSKLFPGQAGRPALLEEDIMRFKTLIAAAVMTAVAAPAFAQSFYVVQDVKTKKCTITETKPTTSEVTVVSGDTVYKTKTEAEAGMKTVKVCTTN
jgi:hypothetical protein